MKKLLLHTCCAPCGIAIIEELKDKYDLTVYFYNPNIYPEQEYLKRKDEVIKVCDEWNVPFIDADYENDLWMEKISGHETASEGGDRCTKCFDLRLAKAAEYAAKNGFDAFATSLTAGRNKKAEVIHPIGRSLAKKFGLEFLDIDWKTGGRQEKTRRLVKEKNIYRQNYCGCRYSKK